MSAWKIAFSDEVEKQLRRIDKTTLLRINKFLVKRLSKAEDPRALGKLLTGRLGQVWRYRVGDYHILCDIQDEKNTVSVLNIGHRSKAYRKTDY